MRILNVLEASGMKKQIMIFAVSAIVFAGLAVTAEDWPAFRHDDSRSGATREELPAVSLRLKWSVKSPLPPRPAWYGPAKWDAYAKMPKLRPMRNYDTVFHPVVSGNSIYYASSSDDSIHCLSLNDGSTKWTFTTEAPIHIAPSVYRDKVYFGSDDGFAYCLNAETGELLWRHSPTPESRFLPANNHYISVFPCRTGVVVRDGVAYFANSLFPWRESWLSAVDAETGKTVFEKKFNKYVQEGKISMEGPFSVSDDYIVAPRGRVSPMLFSRKDGRYVGLLNRGSGQIGRGGPYVVLCDDATACYGPGNNNWSVNAFSLSSGGKKAIFPDANVIVRPPESGKVFILTNDSVKGFSQNGKKLLWTHGFQGARDLIAAGETLYVGGVDKVSAFRFADGEMLWSAPVSGRADGLAVANGNLLVATDEGRLYCFHQSSETASAKRDAQQRSAPPARIADPGLLDRWVFEPSAFQNGKILNSNRNLSAKTGERTDFIKFGKKKSAILLSGKDSSLTVSYKNAKKSLPTKNITVAAWVRIDESLPWGGIAGIARDDEIIKRGWLLGYSADKFQFKLAGEKGGGEFSIAESSDSFNLGEWHFVAGTYDGRKLKLYLDGTLSAEVSANVGGVLYPKHAFYELGAFRDDDEFFPMKGALREIRVYDRDLSESELRKLARTTSLNPDFRGKHRGFKLETGPVARYISPDSALIEWTTSQAVPTLLEYSIDDEVFTVKSKKSVKRHRVRLSKLRRNRIYKYAIGTSRGTGGARWSRDFELDTLFNFQPFPVAGEPDLKYVETASKILEKTGMKKLKGICLLFGTGEKGGLAYELARQSSMHVVGLDRNAGKTAKLRRNWMKKNIYGDRLVARTVFDVEKLPFRKKSATMVVVASEEYSRKQAAGFARPYGGATVSILGNGNLAISKNPPPKGAGVWTDMYGRPDNSTYGGETLRGSTKTDDMVEQWVGRPGPRFHADRNGRGSAPLAVNGRLFFQGLDRVIAIDAWNGSILWTLELAGMRRFNIPRDCGSWSADENSVFLALKNRCLRIAAGGGEIVKTYKLPSHAENDLEYDWGYVVARSGLIIGSSVRKGAVNDQFWGPEHKYGWHGAIAHAKVCSDDLFALDLKTGRVKWRYRGGVVINSTITIAGDDVFFMESRDSSVVAAKTRRVVDSALWRSLSLVSLNLKSGKEIWRRNLKIVPATTAGYLASSDGRLVFVSSASGKDNLYVFDADSGKELWRKTFKWPYSHHGGDLNRPAIVDGVLYIRPNAYDLRTGEQLNKKSFWGCCGTYAAFKGGLVMRSGGVVTMWHFDLKTKKWSRSGWARLRPNCWLSAIPACGMMLVPEDGGGCTCGIWLETSIGFAPRIGTRK
jgi:outer membrane protein assembly factor BamB